MDWRNCLKRCWCYFKQRWLTIAIIFLPIILAGVILGLTYDESHGYDFGTTVIVALTSALVLATFYYAHMNAQMVEEMRKTREAEFTPHFVYQITDPSGGNVFFLMKNLGKGTAVNIILDVGKKTNGSYSSYSTQQFIIDCLKPNKSVLIYVQNASQGMHYKERKPVLAIGVQYDTLLKKEVKDKLEEREVFIIDFDLIEMQKSRVLPGQLTF